MSRHRLRLLPIAIAGFIASCSVRAGIPVVKLPTVLEIPLGHDRTIDVGDYETIEYWFSSNPGVAQIRNYRQGLITVRGVGTGLADFAIKLDGKQVQVLIEVVSAEGWRLSKPPLRSQIDEGVAYQLLSTATHAKAPKDVIDSLCRWVQTCQERVRKHER